MPSCERCWWVAKDRGISYEEQLRLAERNAEPCVGDSIDARRLSAGQFWNEERQVDMRYEPIPSPESQSCP